jgi:hypothetical protein
MKITPEIIAELEHWLHANGRTKADMARSLGLTKQAVGLWFKPQAKLIKPKHWVRLVQLTLPGSSWCRRRRPGAAGQWCCRSTPNCARC